MAYETSENDLFKLEVRLLKSEFDRGTLSTSNELMEAIEARYDELVKTDKWKPSKPKEDPNLIALTATIKSFTDSLKNGKKSTNAGGSSNRQSRGGSAWKYDSSLGSDGTYSRSVEGKDPKTYKWCTGPGHGRKPMWVCGHEPGKCDENYDRNSSQNKSTGQGQSGDSSSGSTSGHTTDADDSIQALRAVLENASFGDDPSAQLQACLALLQKWLLCQGLSFLTVAWPLVLSSFILGYSPMIEAELSKWLTFFLRVCFIFYLPIAPPSQTFMESYLSQAFMDFCLSAPRDLAYHIAYDLHPSCIVMPLLLLLYGILLYYRKPSDTQPQPVLYRSSAATIQWTVASVCPPPTWSFPVLCTYQTTSNFYETAIKSTR
jgi:hypothetical protein